MSNRGRGKVVNIAAERERSEAIARINKWAEELEAARLRAIAVDAVRAHRAAADAYLNWEGDGARLPELRERWVDSAVLAARAAGDFLEGPLCPF